MWEPWPDRQSADSMAGGLLGKHMQVLSYRCPLFFYLRCPLFLKLKR